MENSLALSEQTSTLKKVASFDCSMSNCLDRSAVNVTFAIIAHFGTSLFHDAHVVMRLFTGWINNIAKTCFQETLEWLCYIIQESLND